jgi:hypothetical protein
METPILYLLNTVKEFKKNQANHRYNVSLNELINILKSRLKNEKKQHLKFILFMRLNDEKGKSITKLYKEFYNQNKEQNGRSRKNPLR